MNMKELESILGENFETVVSSLQNKYTQNSNEIESLKKRKDDISTKIMDTYISYGLENCAQNLVEIESLNNQLIDIAAKKAINRTRSNQIKANERIISELKTQEPVNDELIEKCNKDINNWKEEISKNKDIIKSYGTQKEINRKIDDLYNAIDQSWIIFEPEERYDKQTQILKMHDEIYSIDDKIAKLEADNKKIKKQSEKSKFDLSDKVVNQNIVPEQVQQEKNNTNDDDLKNDPVWIEMAKYAKEPVEQVLEEAKEVANLLGIPLKEVPMVPMRRYIESGFYNLEELKQDIENIGLSEEEALNMSTFEIQKRSYEYDLQQEKNNTNEEDLKNDPVWIEMAKIAEEPIEEFIAGAKKAGDEIGVSLKEIPMVPMRRYVEKGLYDLEEFKQDCEDVGLSEEEALNMSTFEFGKKMYEYNLQQEQNVIPSEQLEIDPVQQEQNNTVDATPEIAELAQMTGSSIEEIRAILEDDANKLGVSVEEVLNTPMREFVAKGLMTLEELKEDCKKNGLLEEEVLNMSNIEYYRKTLKSYDEPEYNPLWIEVSEMFDKPIEQVLEELKEEANILGVPVEDILTVSIRDFAEKGLYDSEDLKEACEKLGLSEEVVLDMTFFEYLKSSEQIYLQAEQNINDKYTPEMLEVAKLTEYTAEQVYKVAEKDAARLGVPVEEALRTPVRKFVEKEIILLEEVSENSKKFGIPEEELLNMSMFDYIKEQRKYDKKQEELNNEAKKNNNDMTPEEAWKLAETIPATDIRGKGGYSDGEYRTNTVTFVKDGKEYHVEQKENKKTNEITYTMDVKELAKETTKPKETESKKDSEIVSDEEIEELLNSFADDMIVDEQKKANKMNEDDVTKIVEDIEKNNSKDPKEAPEASKQSQKETEIPEEFRKYKPANIDRDNYKTAIVKKAEPKEDNLTYKQKLENLAKEGPITKNYIDYELDEMNRQKAYVDSKLNKTEKKEIKENKEITIDNLLMDYFNLSDLKEYEGNKEKIAELLGEYLNVEPTEDLIMPDDELFEKIADRFNMSVDDLKKLNINSINTLMRKVNAKEQDNKDTKEQDKSDTKKLDRKKLIELFADRYDVNINEANSMTDEEFLKEVAKQIELSMDELNDMIKDMNKKPEEGKKNSIKERIESIPYLGCAIKRIGKIPANLSALIMKRAKSSETVVVAGSNEEDLNKDESKGSR